MAPPRAASRARPSGGRARAWHLVWAGALLALAFGLAQYRRAFIQSFFVRGPGSAEGPALAAPASATSALAPVPRLRVVLVDGVDRALADSLPSYRAVCERGVGVIVDAGFPTVSLPVQSVLWTGLTQQQSGIQFVGEALAEPLAHSVPARVPGSVAVAEYYPFIARSAGFHAVQPAEEVKDDARHVWMGTGFLPAAKRAVAGDARLVFVHFLRADTAGHKHGRASKDFHEAARDVDAMLDDLLAAEGGRAGTRWLLLADHGHRARGGHGGAEPHIRLVRACIAGDLPPELAARGGLVHMVDLARVVADSVGVPLPPESAGRPLAAALAAPVQPGATLPRPGALRWLAAGILGIGVLALSVWAARPSRWALAVWWPLAYVAVRFLADAPTLSVPMIYKPWGKEMLLAAVPGLLALALCVPLALRQVSAARATVALLALPAGMAAVCLLMCWGTPPLMPGWTAHTSLFLTLLAAGAAVVALAHLALCVPGVSGRGSPGAETPARS